MNKKILLIFAVGASAVLSASGNLVVNPGFETGDFTGWTLGGDTSGSFVGTNNVHSGNYSAALGPVFDEGFLDQTISTIPGQFYTVDFWLNNTDDTGDNNFSTSFAGVTILSLVNAPFFPYTHFVGTVMATGASSDLHFAFLNPPAFWFLDDVAVNAVPEPGTLGLIALGTLGLVGAMRKRLLV